MTGTKFHIIFQPDEWSYPVKKPQNSGDARASVTTSDDPKQQHICKASLPSNHMGDFCVFLTCFKEGEGFGSQGLSNGKKKQLIGQKPKALC